MDVNIADYDKRTAWHLAASQSHVEVVEFLINHHADVNVCDRMGFSGWSGWCGWARACVECRPAQDRATPLEGITPVCPAESIGDIHDPTDIVSAVHELGRKGRLQSDKHSNFKMAHDLLRSERLCQLPTRQNVAE